MRVTIELYGIPRLRAGVTQVVVEATTASEALHALSRACPGLGEVVRDGELMPHYLLSRDGREIIEDLHGVLKGGESLVLLSADPGG